MYHGHKFSRNALIVAAAMFGVSPLAHAANWFELEDTSPATAPLIGVSGFIEPSIYAQSGQEDAYEHDQIPHINLISPGFSQSTTANILRARIMFRGNLNKHISYFFGGEFGDNGFTHVRGGYQPGLIDGHFTFSYIPGAKIEAGLIRAPSAEGAMKGYMSYNFVLPSSVIGQLVQQRMYNSGNPYTLNPKLNAYLINSQESLGVNGYRYPGIMAFDWFRNGPWEFSYGTMVGMYGTVAAGNQSNSPLYAARLQEAYILGGKGPFRSDVQAGIWYQHASPELDNTSYSMNRYGVDLQYLQGYMHQWGRQFRFQYIRGNGWISAPPAFSSFPGLQQPLTNTQLYPGSQNRANGYMLEAGLFLTKHIEANLRYDYYDRLPNDPTQQRIFKTWAIGLQYHFTPLTKIMAGYYFRTLNVPHQPNPVADSISNVVDNEFAMQAIISF
ncbi:porin [Acidithiobacillus thiooxidans]|uniref:porin n=1 Tax=Acidithiobacillus thiooxidans TaxID=930 RepID=UPI001C0771E7|nr:porin [Acidithiobacillus thiooxidans]MBU2836029.1 porin [Acidithiobacillus thiooxidans]